MSGKWMNRFERVGRMVAMGLILLGLTLVLVSAVLPVGADTAERPTQWVCGVGATCHGLLLEGSELYLLTADGHVVIEINGDDSIRVENVSD